VVLGVDGYPAGVPELERSRIVMADRKKIAFLVAAAGIERVELTEPWQAVTDAGYQPVLLSPKTGEVQTVEHRTASEKRPVDQAVGDASVDDFAALVLPGGVANPDALRMNKAAVGFVKSFVESGKPVAAICHAPWMLAEADVVRGRMVTSWPSLQTDLRNAGAQWVDETVVMDGNVITSRKPDDLPAFNKTLLEAVG
jgi:deglycase